MRRPHETDAFGRNPGIAAAAAAAALGGMFAPEPPPVKNAAAAARAKETGMQKAADGAKGEFNDLADAAIRQLADSGREFTTDDVWELLAAKGDEYAPGHHKSALGPRMSWHAKYGFIVFVRYRKSERESRHGNMLRVWKGDPDYLDGLKAVQEAQR